ncbi:MAG TPA: biosynthetic peptidoglycan transglycosylase, partial [Vicinamibacterales bacterium]|nr:biosynthetic peptidoglycan transglycosylase [Vicinamibacterales bacterium]
MNEANQKRVSRVTTFVGRFWRTDLGRAKYLLFAFVIVAGVALAWIAKQSYSVYKLTRGVGDTWFHAADGRRWFRLDEQRHDVPIAAISPHLQNAFVAVEDHRFFHHPGVDPLALGRAVVRNITSQSVQGGSTITQQLAKNLFLTHKRTLRRKIVEAALAI